MDIWWMAFLLISVKSEKTEMGLGLEHFTQAQLETRKETKDYKRGEEDCKNFWRPFHHFMVICKRNLLIANTR